MKGTKIIVAGEPKGEFLEGIISGTPKPGVKVTIKAGVLPVGGRHTWEPFGATTGADGDPRLNAILTEDELQGKTSADAYVSATRCFMYVPLSGEDMNVLIEAEAGTGSANVFTIGERLKCAAGTGQFKQQASSSGYADFVCMEKVTETPAQTATLTWVKAQ